MEVIARLHKEIDVVISCAASINFNEPLTTKTGRKWSTYPVRSTTKIESYFTQMHSNMPNVAKPLLEAWGEQVAWAIHQANIVHLTAKL